MDQNTKDYIEAITSIVQALSVPTAAIVAYFGVTQWRREARARQNAELAEELEICLSNLEHAVARIRNPLGYSGEGQTRERKSDETEQQTLELNGAFVHLERIKKEEAAYTKLDELEIRANVRFKRRLEKDLKELRLLLNSLTAAALSIFRTAQRPRLQMNEKDYERIEKNEEIVWSLSAGDKKDSFDSQFSAVHERIVEKLDKYKI